MAKPRTSFDAIFTALAFLGAGAGCAKSERAVSEPPASTPAAMPEAPGDPTAKAKAPLAAPPPPTAVPQGTSSADTGDVDEKAVGSVDAGKELPGRARTPGGSAACGATGCSAEMRKGGK